MRFQFMMRVDRVLGGVLSLFLSAVVRGLSFIFRRKHGLEPAPRHLVFIKFVGIGSVIRASFLIGEARRRYPSARITFCSFSPCASLVRLYPEVDRVLCIDERHFFTFAWDTIRSLCWLWFHPADWVVDLEVHSRFSSVFTALTGARNRFAFTFVNRNRTRRWLYTHLARWNPDRHVDECYRQLGKIMGFDRYEPVALKPRISDAECERVDRLLADAGASEKTRLVVLNPNSGGLCLERRWPGAHFAALVDALPPDSERLVIFVGSSEERIYTEDIVKTCQTRPDVRVLNWAGRLSFAMLAELLSRTELLVTNDSGPLHLGDIMGSAVISLWGPSSPEIYAPRGAQHRYFYEPVFCSPCIHLSMKAPCDGHNECLQRLPVERVAKEVLRRLGYAHEV